MTGNLIFRMTDNHSEWPDDRHAEWQTIDIQNDNQAFNMTGKQVCQITYNLIFRMTDKHSE